MQKLNGRFNSIKGKHVIWAVVKSLICSISLGIFSVGVLLLSLKLSAIQLAVAYYVLIGVGVACVSFAALFLLLFRPSDKYVAKRTDNDYQLNERVQTALEYAHQSGTIVELQRADAEERIQSLPPQKIKFSRIWQFGLAILLAIAMFVTAVAIPAKAKIDDGEDLDNTPRQVTEMEKAGVRELIANIAASSLEDGLKTSVRQVLEQLLTDLDGVKTEGEMNKAVTNATKATEAIILPTLTYVDLGAALTNHNQTYLGQAVTNGGGVYQYYMLTVYDELRSFDAIRYDATNAKVGKQVTSLRNDLTLRISNGLGDLLEGTYTDVTAAILSSNVAETDGLYVLLKNFAQELSNANSQIAKGADDTVVQTLISDIVNNFTVNAIAELNTQAYNAAIRVFVANRLKIIFGYLPLELPLEDTDKPSGGGDKSDPDSGDEPGGDTNPPGSGDTGESVFGSDDMVWVPGRGYMKYGDVIEEYYNLINQYLHSDELTEEQKSMIRAYYDILFGSNKNS